MRAIRLLIILPITLSITVLVTNINHLFEQNMLMFLGISIFIIIALWQITDWIESLRGIIQNKFSNDNAK
jgi:hypothetical protein